MPTENADVEDEGDGRTTITVDRAVKDRLDGLAPSGSSWSERLDRLADVVERDPPVEQGLTHEDLDGLRDDLLAQLPRRVAKEIEARRS